MSNSATNHSTDDEYEEDDEGPLFTANLLIEGRAKPADFRQDTEKALGTSRVRIYPADYRLNKVENQTLFKWLVQPDVADIRFNTHGILSNAVTSSKRYGFAMSSVSSGRRFDCGD